MTYTPEKSMQVDPDKLEVGSAGVLEALGADGKVIATYQFSDWQGSRADGSAIIYMMNGVR